MPGRQTLWQSVSVAAAGICSALRTERNLRIQLTIAVVVTGTGLFLEIEGWEWCVLTLAMTLVLTLELINTTVEAVVDLASPEWHLLAKQAKDTAAGAVLLATIAAVLIGIVIFGPRLLAILEIAPGVGPGEKMGSPHG